MCTNHDDDLIFENWALRGRRTMSIPVSEVAASEALDATLIPATSMRFRR